MANSQLFKVVDQEYLQKEIKILQLFKNINQITRNEKHQEIIRTFKVKENEDKYLNPEVLEKNYKIWQNGILPKTTIFSLNENDHLHQAIALFELLYFSKDFDTFHKTAVVSRYFYNAGMFLYSFSVAVVHRKDCYGLILPPIYEVNPHYFFHIDVILEAYKLKQINSAQGNVIVDTSTTFESSATHSYLEDIGVNAFFYYYNLHYPPWMGGKEFGLQTDKVGELFYYNIQQSLARYNMERLSNGLGGVKEFCREESLATFDPQLLHPSAGMPFAVRSGKVDSNAYEDAVNFERRVKDVIDQGYVVESKNSTKVNVYCKDGMNILGNILLSSPDSPNNRYHGPILKNFLKFKTSCPHIAVSTALGHIETSARDEVYYKVLKRIFRILLSYKETFASYSEEDLLSPGICVTKFNADTLVTYDDDFFADLSNAVYYSEEELKVGRRFPVTVEQKRLNCKPFNYKIYVNSKENQMSIVKIYFGPKYDEHGQLLKLTDARENFVLLDRFFYGLKTGENIIERSSLDSRAYVPDRTSFKDLEEQVLEAISGKNEFRVDGRENWFFFPRKRMLPKGSYQGTPFQFFVIIYKYVPFKKLESMEYFYPQIGTAALYHNDVALGYPLDRVIDDENMFSNISNCIFKEVKVYHKNKDEVDFFSIRNYKL